jgi:hypothetical protein
MRISLSAVRRLPFAVAATGCAVLTVCVLVAAPSANAVTPIHHTESPMQIADADAASMLAAFRPPPGAEPSGQISVPALSAAPAGTTSPDAVTRTAWWRVPGGMDAALSWVEAHASAGFTLGGSGSSSSPGGVLLRFDVFDLPLVPNVLTERSLFVSVAGDGAGSTAMRVDSQVSWLPTKSPAERIPAAAKVVTITPIPGISLGVGKTAAAHDRPVTIADPATVAKIAAVIDALPLMPRGIFSCPLSTGQGLLLTFRAVKGGPELAVVTGELTGCGTVTMVVDGKRMPTLWGGKDMAKQVLKLAGIHWPGF